MGKVIMLVVIIVATYFLFKFASKLWKKAEVEEKIEDNKEAIELAKQIEKEGKAKEAKDAKKKIDEFMDDEESIEEKPVAAKESVNEEVKQAEEESIDEEKK